MKRIAAIFLLAGFVVASSASHALAAGELARLVRLKVSAGDILSGAAAIEDYKKKNGVDVEYLDALGWLARGAEMLGAPDAAARYVAELRREIREEKPDLLTPLGAAIEVEGKLRATRQGRDAAIKFLEQEFEHAKDIGLRSRIRRSINVLSLEGQPAPELNIASFVGVQPASLASLKGKPVLLFLWAHWCGDCKAQAEVLASIYQKYKSQGLVVIAPTRLYGTGDQNKPASPEQEKAHIAKIWAEAYRGLEDVSVPIDTDTMIRYGVSATPTFVFIDKRGVVKSYSPTRFSEPDLVTRIDVLLK